MICDHSFKAMGSNIRLILNDDRHSKAELRETIDHAERYIHCFDHTLTRFDPSSELEQLNDDPSPTLKVSPLLYELIQTGTDAAERTGGLVDFTLLSEIRENGYEHDWKSRPGASLTSIFGQREASAPHPAAPSADQRWKQIKLHEIDHKVTRPLGLKVDSGGIGKGLACDKISQLFRDHQSYLIDCGGDICIGGEATYELPYRVYIADPFHPGSLRLSTLISSGGIATSGIDKRIWKHADRWNHHLLDPATGLPAWTGIVSVTALAPSASEAETLAKQALLSGPEKAAEILEEQGGVVFYDNAEMEAFGPLVLEAGP